ncbi:TPA: fimbria/pilus outer membrane usher protein [Salmonella enterica subsp. enterica]
MIIKPVFNVFLSVQLFLHVAMARTWTFDPSMVSGDGKNIDVSLFNQGVQLPGTYHVDVYVNGEKVDSRDVAFSLKKDAQGKPFLSPCLNVQTLAGYGIKTGDYPAITSYSESCAVISAIPHAGYDFQFENQQLMLSIPQIAVEKKDNDIAPQALWDDGIPAVLLNYSANTSRAESTYPGADGHSDSSFVQLNPGLNLGPWRLRNQTNWQKQGNSPEQWQTVYTYAECGLNSIKSRLVLGDRYTPGDVFDSVPFRGGMLGSDDSMVPFSQRAFSPVVRGIARTRARIEVRQNGYVVYSATVAPGPFALTDLMTSGSSGGDLQVTVREADGSTQVFIVPYQTPAIALKEGYLEYNVMGGVYRPADSASDISIGQVTAMYGLPWNLTVYGGLQGADVFQAMTAGLGVSMGDWGALSLDGTFAQYKNRHDSDESGGSWRLRYSKDIIPTNTTVAMTRYQYASPYYATLSEALDVRSHNDAGDAAFDSERQKSSSNVVLGQSLGRWGYLSLNDTWNTYWNNDEHSNSLGASYGFTLWHGISMNLNWSENQLISDNNEHRTDRIVSLWLNVPLSSWMPGDSQANATYSLASSSDSHTTQSLGLSGDAFGQRLHWDVHQQHNSASQGGDADNSMMQLSWYGTYGQLGGYYGYSAHQRQMGTSVDGGLVIHRHGVTAGQTLGDTVVLINTPGASGLAVEAGRGIKTDYLGYAAQSWVTPYHENTVSIDSLSQNDDVDITQTDEKVVPTRGAVVLVKFNTRVGGRALMNITQAGGQPVPFGSLVTLDEQGGSAGIVGQGGEVYLTGLPDTGHLVAHWAGHQCHIGYRLPETRGVSGMYRMKEVCR